MEAEAEDEAEVEDGEVEVVDAEEDEAAAAAAEGFLFDFSSILAAAETASFSPTAGDFAPPDDVEAALDARCC